MATPTERVTRRARRILGSDVVIALRVEDGPPSSSIALSAIATASIWALVALPLQMLVAVLALWRSFRNPEANRVLALTGRGGRVLLRTSRWRPANPVEVAEILPDHSPLVPNPELTAERLHPPITIEGRMFNVNGIDFKVLLRHVRDGTVDAPQISAVMGQLRPKGARTEPRDFLR